MRVGIFTYGIDGERMTGIARYTVELTRALKQLDNNIEIILLNPYPNSKHPWYKEFQAYPLPNLKLMPFAASLGNWQLHRAAVKLKLDILHDPCGIAPFLIPTRHYKRVVTICDAIPIVYPKTQPFLTKLIFQTLLRLSRYTADAILTISEASKKDLIKFLNLPAQKITATLLASKLLVKPTTEEISKTKTKFGLEQYFLYVGALHPRKNIERVIKAFLELRCEHHNIQLAIVGPPSWGASCVLKNVLTHVEKDSGIIFTGFVDDDSLRMIYAGAIALVFPSLYEGFGFPVLEAMSLGTPVITSNVSSLPEVSGDAALLVNPISVEEIQESMLHILNDQGRRTELAIKGKNQAKKFSWESVAQQTFDLYKQVIDS